MLGLTFEDQIMYCYKAIWHSKVLCHGPLMLSMVAVSFPQLQ